MEFISSMFVCLSNEGVHGIQAIQYIFSLLFVSFDIYKINNLKEYITDPVDIFVNKLSKIYDDYSLDIDFDLDIITTKLWYLIKKINLRKINKLTFLDEIFRYYLENENLAIIKDYVKYYNNKLLTNWIFKSTNFTDDQNQSIFVANTKINSCIDNILEVANNNKSKNITNFNPNPSSKLFGHQHNKTIKNLIILNTLMNYNKNYLENFGSNDLLTEDINLPTKSFDLIIFDFPTGIHNIIHASCCNKIKKLKLRGTKSEPLLLQLIMCSLNKNGRAILIVPDTLLYGESIQAIETRKYLMENYNVTRVIQIDESFYISKGVKNSILCFENNSSTKNVKFSKITPKENIVSENTLKDVNIDEIKTNLYSLYYKNYENITKPTNKINSLKFNELFEFKTNDDEIHKGDIICLEKYYKNEQSIKISSDKSSDYEHYIVQKTIDDTNFNLKLLENILRTKYLNLVKGKMNQFDLSKIKDIDFPVVPDSIKKSVCEYINITNQMIMDNNDKIVNTHKLKKFLIESISSDNLVELNKISKLCDKNGDLDGKVIGVIRNGLTAGNVYLLEDPKLASNNSHYLKINNINYLTDYVYHHLKNNESRLKDLANLNPQPNLSQTNLLNFTIQDIPINMFI